jgi:peptidoglycan hydrolase CwlO-like protein
MYDDVQGGKMNKALILILVFGLWSLVFGLYGCEQIDTESINKIVQEDPSFKEVLAKKEDMDSRIAFFFGQLRDLKTDTYAKIRMLQDTFDKQKTEIDAKIAALKSELDPARAKIRQEMEDLRAAVSGKKGILRDLENTRRNLTNLINQQRAVSVTAEDMAKWQERLTDLNNQIEPLSGEIREMEERIRLLRLKAIALRQ